MKGTALIYVILTIGIILNIAFFMSAIFSSKLKQSFDFSNSVAAFYAAESGSEWQIFNRLKNPDAASPSLSNGAVFTLISPIGSLPIKVIGQFRGTSRAIETSF